MTTENTEGQKLASRAEDKVNGRKPASKGEDRGIREEARAHLSSQFRERLYKAVALKNRVVSDKSTTGLPGEPAMPNSGELTDIAKRLNRLQCKLAGTELSTATPSSEDMSSTQGFVPSNEDLDELDECIMKLTKIASTETIAGIPDVPPIPKVPSKGYNLFKFGLWLLAFLGIVAAIAGFVTAANGSWTVFEGDSLLAASLGLLGGVAFSFFNVLGVVSATDYDVTDWSNIIARLLLGMLLGWVFYFAFAQSAFANFAKPNSAGTTTGIVILLPFLAGYSTALVVVILDKAMQAVFLTLGIDQKSASVSRTDKSRANTG